MIAALKWKQVEFWVVGVGESLVQFYFRVRLEVFLIFKTISKCLFYLTPRCECTITHEIICARRFMEAFGFWLLRGGYTIGLIV